MKICLRGFLRRERENAPGKHATSAPIHPLADCYKLFCKPYFNRAASASRNATRVKLTNLVTLDDASDRSDSGGRASGLHARSLRNGQHFCGEDVLIWQAQVGRGGREQPVRLIDTITGYPDAELPFRSSQNHGFGVGKLSHTCSRPPRPTRYLSSALSLRPGRSSSANSVDSKVRLAWTFALDSFVPAIASRRARIQGHQRRHYISPAFKRKRRFFRVNAHCSGQLLLQRFPSSAIDLPKSQKKAFSNSLLVHAYRLSLHRNMSASTPTDLVDERTYPYGLGLLLQAINGEDGETEDVHTPSIVTTPIQIQPLFFSDSEDEADEPPSPVPPRLWPPLFPDSESERGQTPLFFPGSDLEVESDRGTPRPLPLSFPADSDVDSDRGTTPTPAKRLLPLGWDTEDEGTRNPVKKKPRRQRFTVADFFDTEAAETDGDASGDEADTDDLGFIDDDEPIHEFPHLRKLSIPFAPENDEDTLEDLEALAAEYEEAARAERQTRQREVPAEDLTIDEKLKLPLPPSLAPIDSLPIFAICVPPRWEFSLLTFLVQHRVAEAAGILSAFSWGVRSGLVCVEVRRFDVDDNPIVRPASALIHALSQWPYAHRCYGATENILGQTLLQPREVPSTEKIRLLCPPGDHRFLDPFRIGHRWARISEQGLYKGDLAFVEEYSPKTTLDSDDYNILHVVPCIAVDEKQARMKRPPQRLLLQFSDYNVLHQIDKVEFRNQIVVWQDRIFGRLGNFDGLEQIQVKQWRYQTPTYELNAIPTDEELELFRQSPSRALNVLFIGHACALQEGDRVVVAQEQHNPYWDAESGVIVRLATHELGGQLRHIAVLLHSYDGVTDLDAKSSELNDAWVVPVAQLRLHLLAFQRFLRFGDRVRIVAGAYRNRSAHVIGVDAGTVHLHLSTTTSRTTVSGSDESPALNLELPLRLVATDFRCGDVVRVTRGPHKGKTGLVIDIHVGGSISFYQVSRRLHIRSQEITVTQTEVQHGKLALVPGAIRQDADEPLIRAPDPKYPKVDDLELDWKDALGADRLVPFRDDDSNPSPVVRIPTNSIVFERFDHSDVQLSIQADDPWTVLERKQKARRQELKDSECWLIGMSVQVVGKHPLKGLRGIVLGYSWLTTRADPKYHKPDYSQLQLQINIDQRLAFPSIKPLSWAILKNRLSYKLVLLLRRLRLRLPQCRRLLKTRVTRFMENPPVIDEITGGWLLEPSLVKKRIDVKVVDSDGFDELSRRFSWLAQYIRKPQRDLANHIGYLVPLERPLKENQIHKDFIGVMCNNKRTVFPIPALTPCRTTPEGQSISDVQGRVIIIGPDVLGSRTHVGQYAEVLPQQTSWPGRVVVVRFAAERDRWGQATHEKGTYHLVALCRAHNGAIGGLPATDFNA
ncbi:hypothetical protein C8F01DRAFT_1231284 [Mycena amicta]|nr:hypothetical protein C8F01DRAFT_1231284 [Mycena amicta]